VLAENVRGCLQESSDDSFMYSDYVHLFNHKLYSLSMKSVPKVLEAYDRLRIKHEPLKLIPPQFDSPLPPLQPAVSSSFFLIERSNRITRARE
jgi:intraflagellar transport protein 52